MVGCIAWLDGALAEKQTGNGGSYRAIDKNEHTAGFGVDVGMDRSDTSHARRPRTQTLRSQDELTFQNVDEFRAFMRVQGNSCTGLHTHNLHLQTVSHGDVFH